MFASFKMLLVYIGLGLPAGLIGVPYTLLVGDISRLYRVAMWIMRAGLRAARIEVQLSGLEHVPIGVSCIFMSNHVSNLDPPVLLPLVPGRCSVMLKKELTKIPVLGTAMLMAKFVPVERGSKREVAQASVIAATAALQSGLHILVYPEGTRSRDGRLAAFKKGPFYLAQQTKAPIIPIAISGTERMMEKGSTAITPGVARVQMLAPVLPSQYGSREEILEAVRSAIAAVLPPEMQPLTTAGAE